MAMVLNYDYNDKEWQNSCCQVEQVRRAPHKAQDSIFGFAKHAWYAHADVHGGETCHQSPEGRQLDQHS